MSKSVAELQNMNKSELIDLVLTLQHKLELVCTSELKASQMHNYHFESLNMLKVSHDKMLGSGVILSISDLKGGFIVNPIMIQDGLSNTSINSLLDDIQETYNLKVQLEPTTTRLTVK